MLTLQKADDAQIVSISTRDEPIENLLTKEWLLTNERGSYASSTSVGCNTRGYHGLLIGSLNPPVNRIMALANCLEMVISEQKLFNLSTFEFSDKFAPEGFSYIKRFSRDVGVHFDYELGQVKLTKSVYLLRSTDTVAIVYDFTNVENPAEFVLRPFVGLRDFHTLQRSYAPLSSTWVGNGLLVHYDTPVSCGLFLSCPTMKFEKDQQWWFNFVYRNDKERGQNFTEDLWTPGFFKCRVEAPTKIVLWANLSNHCRPEQFREPVLQVGGKTETLISADIESVSEDLHRHQNMIIGTAKARGGRFRMLCLAADQFVTKRQTEQNHRTTILAGFPWFADWGRDVFVSLPGLLLSIGRFEDAKSVLTTFAQAADNGMIPNRFDDRSDTAYFNSVDASLWFINAAFQYLDATGDSKTFMQHLLPIICWITDSYQNGTWFGIRADTDGLITAGDNDTQLTWMDAKYDNVAFTPRCGKAVEVNALWYNSLCFLGQFYASPVGGPRNGRAGAGAFASKGAGRNMEKAEHYRAMADQVGRRFCELFWNEQCGYLNDNIFPDSSCDASLRPNQIFAVSLPFSPPLSLPQQKSIVDVVRRELLTPYGLRTLNVQHSGYKGRYTGPQQQRDAAYHQGTVWPYLIGPFVEAYLKVNGFSRKSKKEAAGFIEPLMKHLTGEACLGSVSEIFDGDAPHYPRGCTAQAWSVGELIRAYLKVNS